MMTLESPSTPGTFGKHILQLDAEREIERITTFLQDTIQHQLRRRGAVIGISGGIDSSVVVALCARALGPERVLGIMLPENESDPEVQLYRRYERANGNPEAMRGLCFPS